MVILIIGIISRERMRAGTLDTVVLLVLATQAESHGSHALVPMGGHGGHRGVCYTFLERGDCFKVDCKFAHSTNTEGYPSIQDSGNEMRYENHNERNDRQFDRQPSDNERHHVRPDDRHGGRDDDRQADRSQSREPR
jgi:hypothetical protein